MLTDRGWNAVQAAFDTIIEIETELEARLGRKGVVNLRKALADIAEL
jgi:hypothetical protein